MTIDDELNAELEKLIGEQKELKDKLKERLFHSSSVLSTLGTIETQLRYANAERNIRSQQQSYRILIDNR